MRVEGLNKQIRALQKLGVEVDDLKGAIAPITEKVVNDAKALTPVRTGRLQASIRGSKAKNKAVIRGGTGSRVPYASFVEFGSVHNEAVEMVKRAITRNEQYAANRLDQELKALIQRLNLS